MEQQKFQREKNLERQEVVARQIEASKKDGTYSIGADMDRMVIEFTEHLKAFSGGARRDHGINVMIRHLESAFNDEDNTEMWMSRKTDVFALLSLITVEYLTARMIMGIARHRAVMDLSSTFHLEMSWCLLLVEEFCNIFEDKVETVELAGDSNYIEIRATESYLTTLENADARTILNQKSLWPMTEQPQDWTGFEGNPYNDPLLPRKMIRKGKKGDINVEEVAKVLNALQKSAYKINKTVIKFAKQAYKDGDLDVFKSKQYDTWEARRAVRGGITSARRKIKETFKAATYFSNNDQKYYIPYCIDYRGRVYPMNTVLSSHGTELEKALSVAANPTPLGKSGARNLLIQLSTTFGSKKPLDERVEESMIRLTSGELDLWLSGVSKSWHGSEEPFLALATAKDLIGWRDSGYSDGFMSDVLVYIDASNSGFQLVAGMLRDEKLSPLVNLTPSETVGDLYIEVSKEVGSRYTGPLKDLVDERKVWKRPVMTLLYSLTFIGAWQYLDQAIEGKIYFTEPTKFEENSKTKKMMITNDWKFWNRRRQDKEGRIIMSQVEYRAEVTKMTNLFFKEAMPAVAPLGFRVLDTLQSWARKLTTLPEVQKSGIISWNTPGGMDVHQGKRLFTKKEIKASLSNKTRKKHVIMIETDKIDKKGHASSIVPNMIHSIDAALLWSISLKVAEAGYVHLPCHDAFCTTAGEAEELGKIARQCFIDLVKDNPLQAIKEDLEARYGISLDSDIENENLPQAGNLDLEAIINTDHSFR